MKNDKPTDIACDLKGLSTFKCNGLSPLYLAICSKAVYVIRKMSFNDLLPTLLDNIP